VGSSKPEATNHFECEWAMNGLGCLARGTDAQGLAAVGNRNGHQRGHTAALPPIDRGRYWNPTAVRPADSDRMQLQTARVSYRRSNSPLVERIRAQRDRAVVPGEIGPPSDDHEYVPYRELCDLLGAVACGGREFSPRKVGTWLGKHADRVAGERCFIPDKNNKRRWRLEVAEPLRRPAE
jgi:hypothetical protein